MPNRLKDKNSLTARSAYALGATALLFFIVYTAPHRVHHFFDQVQSASHEDSGDHHKNEQPNKSRAESDCVFQVSANRCALSTTAQVQPLPLTRLVQDLFVFYDNNRPQQYHTATFQIRAPPISYTTPPGQSVNQLFEIVIGRCPDRAMILSHRLAIVIGGKLDMYRITRWGLWSLIAVIFVNPMPLSAHDGWVEVAPAIVEKNQRVLISLLQGNHSNEHKSYRIAGKWDPKYTTLVVVDPKNKANTLTDRLIDFGEDAEAVGPKGPKGFHLAPFVPNDDGLYQALARQTRSLQSGDGPKIVTVRLAKTAFAAFKVPVLSAAKNLKGFDRSIAGDDVVEFIPVNNPLAVFSGGSMTLELRKSGKPISGQVITLVRRIDGFASVQERTTDNKGRVNFAVGPADSYLARAKIDEETPRPDGLKDKTSYESTYVFQVFNRP